MSSPSAIKEDDPFFSQIQDVLSTIDFDVDNDNDTDLTPFQLDPSDPDHIEWMQEYITNCTQNNQSNDDHKNKPKLKLKLKQQKQQNPIDINEININSNQFNDIYQFNNYLSSILTEMISKSNSKKINQNKKRRHRHLRGSSYDEMMKYIPSLNPNPSSTLFRSSLMKKQKNFKLINYNLCTFIIDHYVNIESLKLIHDILQLSKASIKYISFKFSLYDKQQQQEEKKQLYDDNDKFFAMWSFVDNNNYYFAKNKFQKSSLFRIESNMMISCISSILKLCESFDNLTSFGFCLINYNNKYYDYFTHFDLNSVNNNSNNANSFKALKHLTLYIDDNISEAEVSSFPFYAFASSPILAFLKKLSKNILESISIIIDDRIFKYDIDTIDSDDDPDPDDARDVDDDYQRQYEFRSCWWIKKLMDKIFEILNKYHSTNLKYFYFKNFRRDCGTIKCFRDILINFISSHYNLRKLYIYLYDLHDSHLSHLISSIYNNSNYGNKLCKNLEELKLISFICVSVTFINNNSIITSAANSEYESLLRLHYADNSLTELLHLIYNTKALRYLSLICFYGVDTIKFNAFITAIKKNIIINKLEISQLRKDSDTIYSLSKLFKPQPIIRRHHHKHKNYKHKQYANLSWNFYNSISISFGVKFSHFYNNNIIDISDMKLFIDLIIKNHEILYESKINLLYLLSKCIRKNYNNIFIPDDIIWIIIESSLGLNNLNIKLLGWELHNLTNKNQLLLLYNTLKYFNKQLDNKQANIKNIIWNDYNWINNIIKITK